MDSFVSRGRGWVVFRGSSMYRWLHSGNSMHSLHARVLWYIPCEALCFVRPIILAHTHQTTAAHSLIPHTLHLPLPPPPFPRVQGLYLNTSRELKRLDALAFSPIFQHYAESLNGLPTIRAFQRQQLFEDINRVRQLGGGGWVVCCVVLCVTVYMAVCGVCVCVEGGRRRRREQSLCATCTGQTHLQQRQQL